MHSSRSLPLLRRFINLNNHASRFSIEKFRSSDVLNIIMIKGFTIDSRNPMAIDWVMSRLNGTN